MGVETGHRRTAMVKGHTSCTNPFVGHRARVNDMRVYDDGHLTAHCLYCHAPLVAEHTLSPWYLATIIIEEEPW